MLLNTMYCFIDDLSSQAAPLECRIMHKALKMGVI